MIMSTFVRLPIVDKGKTGMKATFAEAWRGGLCELFDGFASWRLWHLIGMLNLRQRYARSRLGQFWLTLSTGISVFALGLVWALLWHQPVANLLPYVAASIVAWTFMTGVLREGSTAFVTNASYYLNQKMSFSMSIVAIIYRNLVVLLHNLVVVAVIDLIFLQPPSAYLLLLPMGLFIVSINALLVTYVIAGLCTRYRDLIPIVASLVQIAFFVTPVLWKPSFVPATHAWLLLYANPFAVFLSLVRDPLVGVSPDFLSWLIAGVITTVGILFAVPFIGSIRYKIIYWL
jgi:ABC-type polysaccharide/polyol phosphate export permease